MKENLFLQSNIFSSSMLHLHNIKISRFHNAKEWNFLMCSWRCFEEQRGKFSRNLFVFSFKIYFSLIISIFSFQLFSDWSFLVLITFENKWISKILESTKKTHVGVFKQTFNNRLESIEKNVSTSRKLILITLLKKCFGTFWKYDPHWLNFDSYKWISEHMTISPRTSRSSTKWY